MLVLNVVAHASPVLALGDEAVGMLPAFERPALLAVGETLQRLYVTMRHRPAGRDRPEPEREVRDRSFAHDRLDVVEFHESGRWSHAPERRRPAIESGDSFERSVNGERIVENWHAPSPAG